ncbi:MAG: 3-dehydroquinate synthase [Gemmatimonadales bacterium]|nr:3-dehydroquinate synthase [Gemmatimonadales bacterium]
MKTIEVRHAGGSYPVTVGTGIGGVLRAHLADKHAGGTVALIADESVLSALAPPLSDVRTLSFPAGERHKQRGTWARLTDELLEAGFDRSTVIVAFGGGVTTDLAGFVASTFLRGVPWVAVPTTTLAMIDAAVGGKTGVDTDRGKNLVGAFHPPSAVIADTDMLRTLPDRAFREGLAEAVKHAAILDAEYGAWMEANANSILQRDPATVAQLVSRSVELKAGVVSGDEHESGVRAILNAGHTVAHSLEMATDYAVPHGEAVAIGLVAETKLAEAMGICEAGTADRIAILLKALHLPVTIPASVHLDVMRRAMTADKKNRAGQVHAALLERFGASARGDGRWTTTIEPNLVH